MSGMVPGAAETNTTSLKVLAREPGHVSEHLTLGTVLSLHSTKARDGDREDSGGGGEGRTVDRPMLRVLASEVPRDAPKGRPRGQQLAACGPARHNPSPTAPAVPGCTPQPLSSSPARGPQELTRPAGQPRTAVAFRTPGAPPSPPIPAPSQDARAGPSDDNQSDKTQSTSRRTQPVPAIEGGKKNSSWRQTLVLFYGL